MLQRDHVVERTEHWKRKVAYIVPDEERQTLSRMNSALCYFPTTFIFDELKWGKEQCKQGEGVFNEVEELYGGV